MSNKIEFVCPKCDASEDSRIEEVQAEMTVTTEVDNLVSFDDGHIEIQYGDENNEDGHVVRYQCKKCGFVIVSDDPKFDEFTQDGLDEHALVKAVNALNVIKDAKGEIISMKDVLNQIKEAHEDLGGEDMADAFNNLFPAQQIKYLGDSMFVEAKE